MGVYIEMGNTENICCRLLQQFYESLCCSFAIHGQRVRYIKHYLTPRISQRMLLQLVFSRTHKQSSRKAGNEEQTKM